MSLALLMISTGAVVVSMTSMQSPAVAEAEVEAVQPHVDPTGDAPLAEYKSKLLTLAFDSATAIPVEPHLNDRAKAQEAIVLACLELNQSERAAKYAKQIGNWRRGTAYADLAYYCVQRDNKLTEKTKKYLENAKRVASSEGDWRADRIRVHVARSYAWLGMTEQAAAQVADVTEAEQGKINAVKAERTGEDAFLDQVIAIDELIAHGDMDRVKNGLTAYVQLFGRFYKDAEKRDRIERSIKSSWSAVPVVVRINLMMDLSEIAAENKDNANAVVLANEARALVDQHGWTVEDQIPLLARLVILRHNAGETEAAQKAAYDAMNIYEQRREETFDFFRADGLQAMAEAYQTMGDVAKARELYDLTLSEGCGNPNSRIKAITLSAVCRSMAVHSVEPDEATWARLKQIREGLGHPW